MYIQNWGLCHLLDMLNLSKIRRDNILYWRLFRINQNNDTQSDCPISTAWKHKGLNGRIKNLSLRSQS